MEWHHESFLSQKVQYCSHSAHSFWDIMKPWCVGSKALDKERKRILHTVHHLFSLY